MIGLFSFSQVLYLIGTDRTFVAAYHPRRGTFGRVAGYLATRCQKSTATLLRHRHLGGHAAGRGR